MYLHSRYKAAGDFMAEQLCVSASCATNKQSIVCLCWCPGLSPTALLLSTNANDSPALQPYQFNELCSSEFDPPVNPG